MVREESCGRHEMMSLKVNTLENKVASMEQDIRDQKDTNKLILASLDDIKTKLLTYSIYLSIGVSGIGLVVGNWDKITKLF
jgi:hypothetical protein